MATSLQLKQGINQFIFSGTTDNQGYQVSDRKRH